MTSDLALYRSRWTRKVTLLLERLIVFPSAHRAHHAKYGPPGNYGMLFSIWDVIFGTAIFPEDEVPEAYGIDTATPQPWALQLLGYYRR